MAEPGEFTIADYYALPDDKRVELIDGVFYDMASPSLLHQQLLVQLAMQFNQFAQNHKNCTVCISPCDVRLDRSDRTVVQPDLFVVCRPHDRQAKAFDGAPDLTLEILSPSSRQHDMIRKLWKYYEAGVRIPDRRSGAERSLGLCFR